MTWLTHLLGMRKLDPPTPDAPPSVASNATSGATAAPEAVSGSDIRFVDLVTDSGAVMAVPVEELLVRVEPLVIKLYQEIGWSDEDFDALLRPMIKRYAEYVHLLPASESHHHARFGGLLIHGLEVAIHAAHHCRESVRDLSRSFLRDMEMRASRKRLWPLAAACGALLHDMGKVLVDMVATRADNGETWNPYECSMADWISRDAVKSYGVIWRAGRRHKRHEPFGLVLTWPIIGPEILALLNSAGRDIFEDVLLGALENDDDPNGLGPIIREADVTSVRRDRESQRKRWREGVVGGHPIINRFLEACNGLIRDKTWRPNEPGSPVWVAEEGVFLKLDIAVINALEWLKVNSSEGVIPNDGNTIAEFLIDSQIARARLLGDGTVLPYWKVTLPEYPGMVGNGVCQCLLFPDPNILFAGQSTPPPVSVSVAPDYTAFEPAPIELPLPEVETAAASIPSPPPEPVPPPIGMAAASVPRTRDVKPPALATAATSEPLPAPVLANSVPGPVALPNTPKSTVDPPGVEDADAYFEGIGILGRVLRDLLVDYAKDPERFTELVCYRERKLILRWPGGIAGYDATAAEVMQYLKANPSLLASTYRGCGVDPRSGSVVIQAHVTTGQKPWQAVVFSEELSRYAFVFGDPRPARDRLVRIDFSRWLIGKGGTIDVAQKSFDKLVGDYASEARRKESSVAEALVIEPSLLANPDAPTSAQRINMAAVHAVLTEDGVPA